MRAGSVAVLLLLAFCIAAPVSAAEKERYGYLTISDIDVLLDNGTAIIHVNYAVDDGTRFIFFLFGKQDLKNKLLKILNYDDAQMRYINLTSAEFSVDGASVSYGDGIYWYPSHSFNVVIPNLTVKSPQVMKNFTMVKEFPGGIGYFGNDLSPPPLPAETPRARRT
jgi:hypothetical protein